MNRHVLMFVIHVLLTMVACSSGDDGGRKLVGEYCEADGECQTGLCETEGFRGGYCTGPCTLSDVPPDARGGGPARCVQMLGAARWADSCILYANRDGYDCINGAVVPDCWIGDDCRGCACFSTETCVRTHIWRCANPLYEGHECSIGLGECRFGLSCRMTAAGTGECVNSVSKGDCYRTADCPELATCSVDIPTETICESIEDDYELYSTCYEVATPPLISGVCTTTLGTPCETSADCDVGSCIEISSSESRCTLPCDDFTGHGDQDCKDYFGLLSATCCFSIFAGEICMYTASGNSCDWVP